MAGSIPPRAVVVTRKTPLEELLERHGTRSQARFVLESRGQGLDEVEDQHHAIRSGLQTVSAAIPQEWRRALVERRDLDRFLFEPDDVVLAVGQDGLVANVAKYLRDQVVIGVNPAPSWFDGVLVRQEPDRAGELMDAAARGLDWLEEHGLIEARTMVEARTSDGQCLRALNEIFVGHASHQSARYWLGRGDAWERHSSSGLIVTTGTGATGWARSICRNRVTDVRLPEPSEPAVAFFVREAFPSQMTGTELTDGWVASGDGLSVRSEMNSGGVVFGDGIERDAIAFMWGLEVTISPSDGALRLMSAS